MRQITINGREYNIGYNLQTPIAYEQLTGKNGFDLQQFMDGTAEPQLTLAYAVLLSCNDPEQLPNMGEFLRSITSLEDMTTLLNAVSAEMQAFYKVDKGDQQHKKAKKGNDSKNA